MLSLKFGDVICNDLADFPAEIVYATGSNLESIPIICGGRKQFQYTDICYKYDNGWQYLTTMKKRRAYAAGIVYDKSEIIEG